MTVIGLFLMALGVIAMFGADDRNDMLAALIVTTVGAVLKYGDQL